MDKIPLEKDELIGKTVQVTRCTDPTLREKKGIIIDETKQMLLVLSQGKQMWIAKDIAYFRFPGQNQKHELNGSTIRFRPEDRVKKAR